MVGFRAMISITRGSSPLRRWVYSPLVALVAWKLASALVSREIILPAPERTAMEIVRIVSSPTFFETVVTTLRRVAVSFGMAVLASIVVGLAAGLARTVEDMLHAPVTVMRSVPTMGVILLSLIWLNSEGAPLLVCALVTFPIMYAAMVAAIRAVDPLLSEMHRVFHIGFWRRVRHFYLPSVVPHLRAGMAVALGLNVKVMIAAEVLSQPQVGIGTMFQIERARLNTPGVFAWSAIVVVLAAVLDAILVTATRQHRKSPVAESLPAT